MICSVQTQQFYLFIIQSALTLFYITIAPISKNQIHAILQISKNRSTEHSTGNKMVPEKVATTCIEDGHK